MAMREVEQNYEDVDIFFKNNVYIPQRIIYLGDEKEDNERLLSAVAAESVIKGIAVLNSINHKLPIRLYINTGGGDEYHGYAIIDAVRSSRAPVEGWVFGQAMSMGAFILQHCKKRVMMRNAMLLFHSGTWAIHNDAKDVMQWAKENERILKQLKKLLLVRMRQKDKRKTMKDVNEIMKTETLLTAQQALKLGFVDQII